MLKMVTSRYKAVVMINVIGMFFENVLWCTKAITDVCFMTCYLKIENKKGQQYLKGNYTSVYNATQVAYDNGFVTLKKWTI
jgi:hypothetical protein